jgi:MFS family permease
MERSRWLALTVLCAAMMMIILDGTIVTVALPAIQRDLGFSPAGLAWVVNAYLIAFGGLLLLAGRLGLPPHDRHLHGRRRPAGRVLLPAAPDPDPAPSVADIPVP